MESNVSNLLTFLVIVLVVVQPLFASFLDYLKTSRLHTVEDRQSAMVVDQIRKNYARRFEDEGDCEGRLAFANRTIERLLAMLENVMKGNAPAVSIFNAPSRSGGMEFRENSAANVGHDMVAGDETIHGNSQSTANQPPPLKGNES